MESLQVLRQQAEARIDELLLTAEIEAERVASKAQAEAQETLEAAHREEATLRAEAQAVRAAAEERGYGGDARGGSLPRRQRVEATDEAVVGPFEFLLVVRNWPIAD